MRHQLTKFIVKNPPEVSNTTHQTAPLKEEKKAKRDKKQDGCLKQGSGNDVKSPEENNEDDNDWSLDTSEIAVKARMEELTTATKGLVVSPDSDKTSKERADLFYSFVKRRRDQGVLAEISTQKDIFNEAERLGLKDNAPLILSELIFDGRILTQMKTYCDLLDRFTRDNTKAQKALLNGMECVIGLHEVPLLPKVPLILKGFYDLDLVEEEVVLDWGSKPNSRYVSKELTTKIISKAEPLIKWLKEAKEESDDESNEGVEIEYDDRARSDTLIEQQNKAAMAQSIKLVAIEMKDGGDEIDIDAI